MAGRRYTILAVAALAVALTISASALAAPGGGAQGLDALLAPPSVCPNQTELGARTGLQVRAMGCMTNFARERRGLKPFGDARALDRAGRRKATDILRCDEFSHEACGREFTYWPRRFGYLRTGCWRAGENIAWGWHGRETAASVVRGWMNSPPHREEILRPTFRDVASARCEEPRIRSRAAAAPSGRLPMGCRG